MIASLPPEALYRSCDPAQFSFATTAELADLEEVIGQERAVEAIQFGIGIRRDGFNLFALGPTGTGRYTVVRQYIEQKAQSEPTPNDWCYVYHFAQPHLPKAVEMPAGRGAQFAQDMEHLLNALSTVILAAFESDEYQLQRSNIEEEIKQKHDQAIEQLEQDAKEKQIALIRTPMGPAFAPVRDGEVLSPDEYLKMPTEEQKQIETEIEGLQSQLRRILFQVPQWKREGQERLDQLNREVAEFAVKPLLDELRQKYEDLPTNQTYLEEVQKDIVDNVEMFLNAQLRQGASSEGGEQGQHGPSPFARYQVNVIVDHSQTKGAPVVYEDYPTYQALVGRVEYVALMGALVTDFMLIKPGAFHRANGGYLILDMLKVLQQPYAWEAVKRVLRAGKIHIESLGQMVGLVSTISLEPQPIPLKAKVILIGEPMLYYLLCEHDPDFMELFKVTADFDSQIARTEDSQWLYARFIATLARKEGLRPFAAAAIARLIERSARLVGDASKLSMHMQSVGDLAREADYWAGENGRETVTADDVQYAIQAQIRRASRIQDRMQEQIVREMVLVDTSGAKVGQVNALSVLTLGNYAFGKPSRVTARVRIGRGEIIDIERQVNMGGPIHSKGVLILASYLGAHYAAEMPLSLSATLVFEQSYGGIEGDSASSTELYALLSAIAQLPIKQSLAVTGSVNQYGEVQAIGGVNEKIEGFFDLCVARGLTGEQGVLIPKANIADLMLRQEVVDAVRAGTFHIYPISTIDEGIELLTGVPAGSPDENGQYLEGTVNRQVITRLTNFAQKVRQFQLAEKGEANTSLAS